MTTALNKFKNFNSNSFDIENIFNAYKMNVQFLSKTTEVNAKKLKNIVARNYEFFKKNTQEIGNITEEFFKEEPPINNIGCKQIEIVKSNTKNTADYLIDILNIETDSQIETFNILNNLNIRDSNEKKKQNAA